MWEIAGTKSTNQLLVKTNKIYLAISFTDPLDIGSCFYFTRNSCNQLLKFGIILYTHVISLEWFWNTKKKVKKKEKKKKEIRLICSRTLVIG